MKAKFLILAVMVCSLWAFAEEPARVITGRVISGEDGRGLPRINIGVKGTSVIALTDSDGRYSISMPRKSKRLEFSFIGLRTKEVKVGKLTVVDVVLDPEEVKDNDILIRTGLSVRKRVSYQGVNDNTFRTVLNKPVSTFPMDVDTETCKTYIDPFVRNGVRPPVDFARIEEMINYFEYDYDQPAGDDLFNIVTEISTAPWNEKHKLVSVGLQGKSIPTKNLPASNLVFLIDVSGSMSDPNKLPLLKASFKMLVNELREQDYISIVVYAGAAGLVLEPTSGTDKDKIIVAIDNLEAGGSTAGGAGITLAYKVAQQNFKKEGNNRVILATDGDFEITSSENRIGMQVIEAQSKQGIYLSVVEYGSISHEMKSLAEIGKGRYAYIENLAEAKEALVSGFGGPLPVLANDVKLEVQFNGAHVLAYRLIGYENGVTTWAIHPYTQDKFDLRADYTITGLYEIIPAGETASAELMTVKLEYKTADTHESKFMIHAAIDNLTALENTTDNFRWAASVAAFGMLLRESNHANGYTCNKVVQLAESARGTDKEGYRIDFITMVKSFGSVASRY